ncbi:hypothetical protein [Spirochaeta cellobiosiphila]|uniref:hypothetical protein n=1 Tax=Spirochaeta cellobiosiphila TaxID=504483 RepID=UPI00040F50E4|nr:hypothetical protein [Spirochaeta cellobiosiphila]
MKVYFSFLLLLIISTFAFPQLSYYGDYTALIIGYVRQDNYDTAINPDNIASLKDINLSNSMTWKMSAGDDNGHLELWFGLNQYPIGAGLVAAAYDGNSGTDLSNTYLFVNDKGDNVYSIDLMRANVNWTINQSLLVRLGRQSLLTGYGYGWNPIDFANTTKDPTSPLSELKGVDSLTFQLFPYELTNLKFYFLFDDTVLEHGTNYDELKGGSELSLSLPVFDVKLTGFLDQNTTQMGIGSQIDMMGVGVYGEYAIHFSNSEESKVNSLLGIEYVFPWETSFIIEYYSHQEGFSEEERDNILLTIKNDPLKANEYWSYYNPGYYSQYYGMAYLSQPFYSYNIQTDMTLLFSLDSGALYLIPEVIWQKSGSLIVSIGYTGILNTTDDPSSEAYLAPVKHSITFKSQYSF